MQYIANAKAKKIDGISIRADGKGSISFNGTGSTCCYQNWQKKEDSILIVCGAGNNGADGVAAECCQNMVIAFPFYCLAI